MIDVTIQFRTEQVPQMDPDYTSEDESSAMAAAMGFSSFGSQGPAKKRKFNPKTDALVDGQELEALDRGGKKGQGSGGNTIPLGKARVFGQGPAPNDEIALDEEPQYLDTSLPAPADEAREMQERIDGILAGLDEAEGGVVAPGPQHLAGPPSLDAASVASTRGPRGQRNDLWYMGYFDAASVENPWARLEGEKGLEVRGSWPDRSAHYPIRT
jgi:hypothetical protein